MTFTDGWKEITNPNQTYFIQTMDEFTKGDHCEILTEMYLQMAENTAKAMKRRGLNTTTCHIFTYLLSDTVLLKILDYKMEALVMNGHLPLSLHKFKQLVGTR